MLGISLVYLHGLLIVAGQHHLGAPAHTQHTLVLVEGLGREEARLGEDELIDNRQYRRVEAHRVLDKEYHLHAHAVDVVLGVELVLEQLDYGQQQVDVAEP